MKKLSIASAIMGFAVVGAASAADVTLYYSPTCPHCHHAREFIENNLIYEYKDIKVTRVNVMEPKNLPMFQDALKKCEYESGGVPVLVIGDKCFQGYADFMQDELRDAVTADMSESAKSAAADVRAKMESDADAYRNANSARASAVSEYNADDAAQKKTENGSVIWFWGLLAVLVLALGIVVVKRKK